MSDTGEIDYGPLAGLVGVWTGKSGFDIAPEPNGTETNPYFETIKYSLAGDATNAEAQKLAVVHYRQVVQRQSNNKVFHDQSGYWMWDAATNTVMHSFTIPRGVCVLAGGIYEGEKDGAGRIVLNVSAKLEDSEWKIIQSPFMQKKASTLAFNQQITVGNGTLSYAQTTLLDIYGKKFEHTDENELTLS